MEQNVRFLNPTLKLGNTSSIPHIWSQFKESSYLDQTVYFENILRGKIILPVRSSLKMTQVLSPSVWTQ